MSVANPRYIDGFVHRFPTKITDAFDGDNDNTYLSTCRKRDAS